MKSSYTDLPILLKRKHMTDIFGLSDSLYYSLLKSGELPTVKINGRYYIHRDKLLEQLDSGIITADF